MKTSQEFKRFARKIMKHYGKKNGVVRSVYLESPSMERKEINNKIIKARKDIAWKNEIND